MKAKLKVNLTIRIDETEDFNTSRLKEIVRQYCKENKFSINDISFKADYTATKEEKLKNEQTEGSSEEKK